MSKIITILIVEDEMIIAANIAMQLSNLGYKILGIIPRADDVMPQIIQNQPDIILLDINLKSEIDGIEVAQLIQKEFKIPIIFLTANADEAHFNRAKSVNPYAFISKPYKKLDLQRAIELTIIRIEENKELEKNAVVNTETPFVLSDCIFVRSFDKMIKVALNDNRFTSPESHPYCQAKFMANQVVEKFIKENPNLSFEISSVSPVTVMGKSMSNRDDSTSSGLQYLIKNKIAPDDFIQALYDNDVSFAIVDVEDVAFATYKTATTMRLHGKDYLLTSETYKISDLNLMLNHQEPKDKASTIYKNDLATADLGIQFKPVKETLNNYSK